VTPDTEFWWDGLAEGELRIQRCLGCETPRHPPEPACPRCGSLEWDWLISNGDGTVYSHVVMREPRFGAFDYPYVVALIDLDEGARLIANIDGIDPAEIVIGMRVNARIRDFDGLALPVFVPCE
jgi:hypothetical protein